MRRTLIAFALLILASGLANGQSACAQLGVDCSHPHVDQTPSAPLCDSACRQEAQRKNEEYWKGREAYDRERAEEKQRRRAQNAEEKANKERNRRITEANKLAGQAWAFMQSQDCSKALELYDKALKLTKFLQWSKNRTVCLANLHRFDEAYSEWERLINDRSTPDADIRGMRMEEWDIMYFKGYVCPVPPYFHGTQSCYRRPDRKTLDTTYVPLPYISGKSWTAEHVLSSGEFTVTTRDGHEWHSGEVNMTTLDLLDARIRTGKGTVVRFQLPDSTMFEIGPNSDVKFDNFVYDPNESYSVMTMNLVKGIFRFVTGILSHPDATRKSISLPGIDAVGLRGTDVEIEHDPNGKGTPHEGLDRWWICTYDGDVNVRSGQDYPVPVGRCFVKVDHADGWPVWPSNDHGWTHVSPNYDDDDSPGAAALAIRQKSQLSVTDFWDSQIVRPVTGRQ